MGHFGVREIDGVVNVNIVNDNKTYLDEITEYGVRFIKGQSSPTGERVKRINGELIVGSATGLEYNIGKDDVNVLNSFDYIPAFKAENVIVEGNYFRRFYKHFMKYEVLDHGGTIYEYYWISLTKHDGYFLPHVFIRNDGTEREYHDVGRYKAFRDDEGKLRSIPNVHPTVSRSGANFLTDARANDGEGANSKYLIGDIWEKGWFNFRQQIRLATRNVQSVLTGVTNLPYSASHLTIGDQVESNELVLSNSNASGFIEGQSIGDAVSPYRRITKIEVDFPEEGQTTITFDGEPADIAEGSNVRSRAYLTGLTDSVVATDGYYKENNGKYPIKIDGIENPFGDIWENVAGVKVHEHQPYVTTDTSKYNWSSNTEDYHPLSYTLPTSNGYGKEMGHDPNFPLANLTSETEASSSTYYSDYFYQNTGWRTVLVGGFWSYGSSAGLWFWNAAGSLGYSGIGIGARLSHRP